MAAGAVMRPPPPTRPNSVPRVSQAEPAEMAAPSPSARRSPIWPAYTPVSTPSPAAPVSRGTTAVARRAGPARREIFPFPRSPVPPCRNRSRYLLWRPPRLSSESGRPSAGKISPVDRQQSWPPPHGKRQPDLGTHRRRPAARHGRGRPCGLTVRRSASPGLAPGHRPLFQRRRRPDLAALTRRLTLLLWVRRYLRPAGSPAHLSGVQRWPVLQWRRPPRPGLCRGLGPFRARLPPT